MEIETDGTLKPFQTLAIASKILRDHLAIIGEANVAQEDPALEEEEILKETQCIAQIQDD